MADMEEMIKEEISRIGGLKERVVFKDVIERLFLSLYETNQEMYRELESRIMDDLVFDLNRYQITMGIMESPVNLLSMFHILKKASSPRNSASQNISIPSPKHSCMVSRSLVNRLIRFPTLFT